ncbi:hypothetical protein E0H73_34070 [Kribbella pittospori]|uniref:Uncharacterized protein n=1 Tax=Kribbella pittospori TaxID=722689 RepID=A0A4R0K7R7_9ACTN|nr:hypothetical protein [Kribbella pittospori]TCC56183.1 hypothetical protein E0H73_34070 [Kribbella pittospori]
MEHASHTPPHHTHPDHTQLTYAEPTYAPLNVDPPDVAAPSRSTPAERQARTDWLVTELRRLASTTDNPHEQANLRRSADSLIRLATASRP